MKKPVHKVPTTWHKMETSFYREPNKSENINPNKTLSGPTAQRREPWETRCLFTHDGTGGGQHSDNSLRDRLPAATPGSSLQAVTTKYSTEDLPANVEDTVRYIREQSGVWSLDRDAALTESTDCALGTTAAPDHSSSPPPQRACWRGRCAAGSVHSHQQQHAATEQGTIISRAVVW